MRFIRVRGHPLHRIESLAHPGTLRAESGWTLARARMTNRLLVRLSKWAITTRTPGGNPGERGDVVASLRE